MELLGKIRSPGEGDNLSKYTEGHSGLFRSLQGLSFYSGKGVSILEYLSRSPEETKKFARFLARYLKPGDLVLFYGDLGSGKTTFIQGICEGLEVNPDIIITSPTFAIVNLYEGIHSIAHVDLYRLEAFDIDELGLWEYLNTHIMLIEWAEKLVNLPKEDFLEVKIQYVDETIRSISLIGYGEWLELLKALERDVESGI